MTATLNEFYNTVKCRQIGLTIDVLPRGKLGLMAKTLEFKPRAGPKPTAMGERILLFMKANNITNNAQFAEGVLGISRQTFHAWLYKEMNPDKISAKPLLLCAEALSTNAEYLLGISDDPRSEHHLSYREAQLVDAFRVLSEKDQDRLLRTAADWVGDAAQVPSTAAPFRILLPNTSKEPK